MIYFAHFSFENPEGKKTHGYFTCILKAGDFQEALWKISPMLADLEDRRHIFGTPVSIYLDDLIEVRKVPFEGLVAHMIAREGPLTSAKRHSLPGLDAPYCRPFSVAAAEKNPETAKISPFLAFD
jgi:hypothetical protein